MSALAILTNCPLANCPLAKRPLAKCLDTCLHIHKVKYIKEKKYIDRTTDVIFHLQSNLS